MQFQTVELTLISLCSKNCRMTFLKYSKLSSSSDLEGTGDCGLEVWPFGDGKSGVGELGDLVSSGLAAQ